MKFSKNIVLLLVLVLVGGAIYFLEARRPERGSQDTVEVTALTNKEKAAKYPVAKEITTPDGFINADSVSLSEFIGKKVVLVDFWTYSCINCQRTTPYLNAWYEKYKDKGFVIIGVHTPEFDFEKEYENVKAAVEKFGIQFPVVLDNDYSTWTAYQNRYWPRKYLIDIDGYIVYDHIGEGGYAETEEKIQELLRERALRLGMDGAIGDDIVSPAHVTSVSMDSVGSPETYFGASRNEYLANGSAGKVGVFDFTLPKDLRENSLYLDGTWNIASEFAKNETADARIVFPYTAKNVYFVAGADKNISIEIWKDGAFVGTQVVRDHTLYHLIEDADYGKHTLEIRITQPGLSAFTFTFG